MTETGFTNRFLRLPLLSIFLLQIFFHQGDANACICPRILDPVCGTDGKTYPNACSLACAASTNGDVMAAYEGYCVGEDEEEEGIVPTPRRNGCVCPRIYRPVCGSDGKFYSSPCVLQCQPGNLKIVSEPVLGECSTKPKISARMREDKSEEVIITEAENPSSCVCTKELAPVCGSDGETYGNKCLLRCVPGVKLVHQGKCSDPVKIADTSTCTCTKIYDPVCGLDGVTYSNLCLAKCAKATVKKRGDCEHVPEAAERNARVCACGKIHDPVCGSDGNTYVNECLMACRGEGLYVVKEGDCDRSIRGKPTKPPPLCFCPLFYLPVCGSDDITYANMCELKCNEKNGVTKVKEGSCDGLDTAAGFRSGRVFDPPPPFFDDDDGDKI